MLLAIDTSSLVLSCALAEKDRLISEWTVQRKLTHSEQLIPHLDNMMKDAGVSREEITAVACSLGPGSFTGLRIGLASIKMMACIWDVPLIGVDTLEALAWNMAAEKRMHYRLWMRSAETYTQRCTASMVPKLSKKSRKPLFP